MRGLYWKMISCYNNIWNCLQAVLAYICNKYDIKSSPLIVFFLGMQFVKKANFNFGDCLFLEMFVPFSKMVENYYKWKIVINGEKNIPISMIESELTMGHQIILEVDTYGCSWNPSYGISHGSHFCLIEMVNNLKQVLEIRDPYYGVEKRILSFEEYRKYKKQIYAFYVDSKITNICLKSLLKEYAKIHCERIPSMYDAFFSQLKLCKWDDLFENKFIESCKVIVITKQISNSYKGLLKYVIKEEFEKEYICFLVKKIIEKWEVFRTILLKCHILGELTDISMKKMTKIVVDISYLDMKLVNWLKEY